MLDTLQRERAYKTPDDASDRAVVVTTDAQPAEWDAFVRAHPEFTGYHLWRWRRVFERALGHQCLYFAARRGNRLVGVLPTVRVNGLLFGRVLSSLPFVNYGGVLADDAETAEALRDAAAETVTRERLAYLVLRHRTQQFPDLPVRDHKVTMLLPLKASPDEMWNALDRKVRNQVRKGEKSGLSVTTGGAELLDGFYRVFARNMRDLGTPVYGRALFAELLREFPDDVHLHLVTNGSSVIAGAISYRHGDVVEVPSASSLREHRALCPNHLMYWHMIKAAIAAGARTFDFGRSTPNDGTYHFKEQWGAQPVPLFWEYALAPGRVLPSVDRHDSRFRLSIEAWKRLPVGVATMIGPRIVRTIP